ncbi:MAG: hypothetical protein ABJC63_00090 [Gemmatimonadales bacterium]
MNSARWLSRVYRRLPVVRELRDIQSSLAAMSGPLRVLETTAMIQALASFKANDVRYGDSRRLLLHGAQYWSQNLEDGMTAEIFRRIGSPNRTFLEIGVGDGSETNTTFLLALGWSGWWIEASHHDCSAVSTRLREMPSLASRLKLRQGIATPDNVMSLLREMGVPDEVDLFSLDIDLNTYHLWAALGELRPRVVIVEYNAAIPPDQSWIHPFEPGRDWDHSQAFGASLKAYELLGRKLGYSLVGCDLAGINAFFVREDLVGDRFAPPFTAENHYQPPRYGLSFRFAHKRLFFGESHVPLETP